MSATMSMADEILVDRAAPELQIPTQASHPVSWLPWANPNRPATAAEERDFVQELAARCSGQIQEHRRGDTTAMLNALRGGLTVTEVLENAPGLKPARLYGAYLALDSLRAASEIAWFALQAAPSVESIEQHSNAAELLIPVPIQRIRLVAAMEPQMLNVVIDDTARRIVVTRRAAHQLEAELDRCFDRSDRAIELGRELYDPTGDSVFGRTDYLPERVGGLVPQRVSNLIDGLAAHRQVRLAS